VEHGRDAFQLRVEEGRVVEAEGATLEAEFFGERRELRLVAAAEDGGEAPPGGQTRDECARVAVRAVDEKP
jgi:hypothetical protein